ncbi:MAG: FAD-dependent oxidoreductase [Flavobacteriaceae bacterium]|jgi:NADPH-dependent 2,4-dienoyl-CoA reductase/sulfur reductase-like enzyme/peroxiredoxin family protein/rhodanese-related sulfurtransferase/TusA-related sulfurtransferase|nr:FAD-dependent oxidoreductase [Flavobacteriaceae bacterium]
MKVVIIGGVAGGASTATRLRRMDENAEIILLERGEYFSYANCGLPYYIGDVIKDRERLFVQTKEGFKHRFNIDARPFNEVLSINRIERSVTIKNLKTGDIYEEFYDKLVISTGVTPFIPPISGIDNEKIFTLRNVPDTDRIKNFITQNNPKNAVIVGGGFIGLEMAENLHHLGMEVAVIEALDQVMAPIDFSMAAIVHQHMKDKEVGLFLSEMVDKFESADGGVRIYFKSGRNIKTDMVIWSAGVRPETKLAKEADLEIGKLGGIFIDEYMQTSDPDIYALGDVVEVNNPVLGKSALISLAGPANKQGRIVADNIVFGNKRRYEGSIGTSIAKVFDLTVASTGVSAKVLRKENIPYISSYTHSLSHAEYYPSSTDLDIKIVFSPENGKLLGAQVVGYKGVESRINLFAQVIKKGGTIYDLEEIEHAYAPPFSSAKDPVNIAGFVADNILNNINKIVYWRDVVNLDMTKNILIDVRTQEENALGTIPNSVNIPLDELRNRINEIPKDKRIIVFCAIGLRGNNACRILTQRGFNNVVNLSGGYKTYKNAVAEQNTPNFGFKDMNQDKVKETCHSLQNEQESILIDACGLQCPGPIMRLKKSYDQLAYGQKLAIKATDTAFANDVRSWCNSTGAKLLSVDSKDGVISAVIEKNEQVLPTEEFSCPSTPPITNKGKSFIVFSNDLDKAMASFILANGAAMTGQKVTMFFTFWGLSIIKKATVIHVKKDIWGKMFGWMLPSNSKKLGLSKMNMGGMGPMMMRKVMKEKNVFSLEELIQQAVENNIEMIACTMSMDVMGIKKEELLDNVRLGGVATYIDSAERSNVNLFI